MARPLLRRTAVRPLALALAAGLLLAPALARADAPGSTAPHPPSPTYRTDSYRAQLFLADVAAIGLTIAAAETEPKLMLAGWAGFIGFAPIVHSLHDNGRGAAISLGLRVGIPLAGAAAGMAAYHLGQEPCRPGDDLCDLREEDAIDEMALGISAGLLAAMVIDYAVLGETRVKVSGTERAPTWTPVVSATAHGVSLGVSGLF